MAAITGWNSVDRTLRESDELRKKRAELEKEVNKLLSVGRSNRSENLAAPVKK